MPPGEPNILHQLRALIIQLREQNDAFREWQVCCESCPANSRSKSPYGCIYHPRKVPAEIPRIPGEQP